MVTGAFPKGILDGWWPSVWGKFGGQGV